MKFSLRKLTFGQRIVIAFALVVVASIGGAWLAGHQASQAAADSARKEAEKTGYEQDRRVYLASIAACKRGNIIRAENNKRVKSHEADTKALREFLKAAQSAREAAYDRDHNLDDLEAERKYGALVVYLDENVKFSKIALTKCEQEFPPPPPPR